jgi:hypothetical protein
MENDLIIINNTSIILSVFSMFWERKFQRYNLPCLRCAVYSTLLVYVISAQKMLSKNKTEQRIKLLFYLFSMFLISGM